MHFEKDGEAMMMMMSASSQLNDTKSHMLDLLNKLDIERWGHLSATCTFFFLPPSGTPEIQVISEKMESSEEATEVGVTSNTLTSAPQAFICENALILLA